MTRPLPLIVLAFLAFLTMTACSRSEEGLENDIEALTVSGFKRQLFNSLKNQDYGQFSDLYLSRNEARFLLDELDKLKQVPDSFLDRLLTLVDDRENYSRKMFGDILHQCSLHGIDWKDAEIEEFRVGIIDEVIPRRLVFHYDASLVISSRGGEYRLRFDSLLKNGMSFLIYDNGFTMAVE